MKSYPVNKTNNNQLLLAVIITAQILVISFLSINIREKRSNILGKTSVNVISSRKIVRPPDSKYEYFYELQSKIHDVLKQQWTDVDKQVIYTSNSDSMNERIDYAVAKPKNVFRLITLGDSFTYGLNVSTVDNWTELLERDLNQKPLCKKYDSYEVLNLGVYGYDVNYAVERYRLRGMKYDPDLIVWLVKEDDFVFLEELIRKNMYKGDNFMSTGEDYLDRWDETVNLVGLDNLIETQTESLKSIRDYFKKSLLISEMTNYDKVDKVIRDFVENDPDSYLLSFNLDKKLIFSDSHPNEAGHRYIADRVFESIVKNHLIPCD